MSSHLDKIPVPAYGLGPGVPPVGFAAAESLVVLPSFPAAPLRRLGPSSLLCPPCLPLCVGGVGVPVLAHRAQLGRVGGSRWGWVL